MSSRPLRTHSSGRPVIAPVPDDLPDLRGATSLETQQHGADEAIQGPAPAEAATIAAPVQELAAEPARTKEPADDPAAVVAAVPDSALRVDAPPLDPQQPIIEPDAVAVNDDQVPAPIS